MTTVDLTARARGLGLKVSTFEACLTSARHFQTVYADAQAAQTIGATGTPSFVVNGLVLNGAKSFEELSKVIDKALASSRRN